MTDELRRARMPVMNCQIIIPTMRSSNAVHVARANSNQVLNYVNIRALQQKI